MYSQTISDPAPRSRCRVLPASRWPRASSRFSPHFVPGLSIGANARYSVQELAADNPLVNAAVPSPYAGRKGQAIPYSNKFGASASVDQQFHVMALPAFAHADLTYTGKGYTAFDPKDPTYRQFGDYTIVNLRAGVEAHTWTASVYAKNVGNTRGITTWRVEGRPGLADRVYITPPREVGISMGYRF